MINQQRLIDTFFSLVKIDSPTDHENEMAEYCLSFLKKLGLEATRDKKGNVIGRLTGIGESVLLSAHLDTVEPGRGVKPIIENSIIKSGGNTILGGDNKIAAAAILEVLQTLQEQELDHRPVEIVFTLSEESGNFGAIDLDYSLLKSKEGLISDSTGEELGTIILGSPYYYRFDIELVGKSAHASRPEAGLNPLQVFGNFNEWPIGRIDEDTVCNYGIIQAGEARNSVPGKLLIKGEVRSFYEERILEVLERIKEKVSQSFLKREGKMNWQAVKENDGFVFNEEDKFVQTITEKIQVSGITPKFQKSWGCYDSNIFVEQGIKVLNVASGVQKVHTVEENIAVADFFAVAEIFLSYTQV